ncbi:NBS-LRR type disease resistance protein [Melia azedarach]|uniref:NBS-LRR type disease resistance protein n=1 Tax=Melia azedarach TaxID=155640 RepID=A0ACC1Y6Z6_MELAZ|nr:NBS-LRR type disease resistance protein [Melia azedarach]
MGNFCATSISCDDTITWCLDATINRARYLRKLEDNLEKLQIELEKLIEARNDVVKRVVIAERQGMKRTEQVQGWLSRVQQLEAEVGELQKAKSQHIENLCLGGCCFKTCNSSYEFGKKVAKKLKVVATLREKETSKKWHIAYLKILELKSLLIKVQVLKMKKLYFYFHFLCLYCQRYMNVNRKEYNCGIH